MDSLEEVMELINRPIEIHSETLGTLNFRHIYDEDYSFIVNCLNDLMDEEIFSKKFLVNQLSNPIFDFDDFDDLDNNEIYFILKKYIEVENLEKYFDFNTSKDIFTIFKEGMECYVNHVTSVVRNSQLELFKSANSIINSFNFHESIFYYSNRMNEISIKSISETTKFLNAVKQGDISRNKTLDAVNKSISHDIHVFQMINLSAAHSAINIRKIVDSQKDFWQNWLNVNYNIQNQITEMFKSFWNIFEDTYKLSSLVAQNCLKEYNWFISPNMEPYIAYDIIEVFNSSSNHKKSKINKLFFDYFIDNECEKLESMVKKWYSNPLFEGRTKIIKDCVNFIKNNDVGINHSNLVVPTLIAQIDGIQRKFMDVNGISMEHNQFLDSDGKKITQRDYFRQWTADNNFYDAMNDVFLDVLFQNTFPGEKCKSLHFSRHKILHGEIVSYGRKDFMIRCFMILDFLSELGSIKS